MNYQHNDILLLNEFNRGDVIGIILQEMTVMAAEPKILSDNGRVLTFETNLQDDSPNRNKRRYPDNVLAESIASARVQELIATRSFFGECDHPFDAELARQMVIDKTRVSHLVSEIAPPKKGIVRGVVETASTTVGRDFRGLIVDNRLTPAFSMRGVGNVRRVPGKDYVEVMSPMALFAYDWVTFPSHKNAYADRMNVQNEGAAIIRREQATQYALDQSKNVQLLTEQFELDDAEFTLTENQASVIIRSNQAMVKVFLESSIRREFHDNMRKLF